MMYNYLNKPFSDKITLTKNGQSFGEITFNNWKSEILAYFGGKIYYFKKESFWKSKLLIFENQTLIGEISFKSFSSKVIINVYSLGVYDFYPTDFWGKKWKLFGERGEILSLEKNSTFWNQTGNISSDESGSEQIDLLSIITTTVIFIKMRKVAVSAVS